MEEYLDLNKKKLEKGFYSNGDLQVCYFTGRYTDSRNPLFQEGGEIEFMEEKSFVKKLFKIDEKYVNNVVSVLKEKANWLEKKLKE